MVSVRRETPNNRRADLGFVKTKTDLKADHSPRALRRELEGSAADFTAATMLDFTCALRVPIPSAFFDQQKQQHHHLAARSRCRATTTATSAHSLNSWDDKA
jgi:hypothetical protein